MSPRNHFLTKTRRSGVPCRHAGWQAQGAWFWRR